MSSETPKGPTEERPTEPFARGKITWGRPPQAVFQVGPLPRAGAALAAAPRPVRPAGAGILSGSMVPPAKPAAEPVAEADYDAVEFEPVIEPEAIASPPEPEPEPVAVAVEPEPLPEPVVAPQEILVEPDAPEPAVTVPPPLSSEAKPAAEPRKLPSVVVTPAIYATVGAAIEKVTKKDRWLVLAGIAAVLVTGAFIWLATLPAPQPVDPAPAPLIADAPPVETAPAEVSVPEARPAPDRTASVPEPQTPAAPVTAQPRPSAPSRAAPIVIAPVEAAPQPYIETAPLGIEPPIPAPPAPTDPDAPISTRPQPLN